MARYSSFPDCNSPPEPLESVLRVGQVRIRPYRSGNVKHAHVVLKKVDEEEYKDSLGRKRTRAVFSLFAQKVINVKPGKEIFFAVEDHLQGHVVAFEADLQHADEADADIVNSAKSEETLVQRDAHALPPKMRKMWARRESVPVKQDLPSRVEREKISVGVQAIPVPTSVGVQTPPIPQPEEKTPSSLSSYHEEAQPLSVSVEVQKETVDLENPPSSPFPPSLEEYRKLCLQSAGKQALESEEILPNLVSSVAEDISAQIDLPADTDSIASSHERSLSPMELESVPSSPVYSPRLPIPDIPPNGSGDDVHPCGKLHETAVDLRVETTVARIESPTIRIKEEPEEIMLPPAPKPKLSSSSFRAPVFVPARHNPFQRDIDVLDRNSPSPPAEPQTSTEAKKSVSPKAPIRVPLTATTSMSTNGPISPVTRSNRTVHPHSADSSPSLTMPYGPSTVRGVTRPAPMFIPASRLSQSQQAHQLSPSIPKLTIAQNREQSALVEETFASGSDLSRKRKRWDIGTAVANLPEPQAATTGLPSKKWKPIVKQEPQSPVLSAVPLSNSSSNSFPILEPPRPPLSSLSIPSSEPSSPAAYQTRRESWATPIVKTEHVEYGRLSFNSPVPRPYPITPLPYNGQRSFVDLTIPRSQRYPASASAPVKRFDRARRRPAGLCSSLPIIGTAQIKMDGAGGRDSAGVRAILFDSTGDRFAVVCRDNSVRIWDNVAFMEIAKLAHSSPVVSAVWMDGDISVASMGTNGTISKWSLVGKNRWMWEKLLDSGDTDPSCFTYYHHLIAVANPRRGIKIWECKNESWVPLEPEIPRRDILSIKFVNDGNDLLCSSSDGTVVRCSVSSFRMQPVATFKTKVFHVDANASSTYALVAQAFGSAHLIDIAPTDKRAFGRVLQDYSLREAEQQYGARGTHGFKPIFADYGDIIVFGSVEGRVLVWDRQRGQVIHEMDHGHDVFIQAVASFDGGNGDQHLVSCTKHGLLTWWRLPIRIF